MEALGWLAPAQVPAHENRTGTADPVITPIRKLALWSAWLEAQPAVIPREQTARFYIGKVDWQAHAAHRVTGRYIYFENDSPANIASTIALSF